MGPVSSERAGPSWAVAELRVDESIAREVDMAAPPTIPGVSKRARAGPSSVRGGRPCAESASMATTFGPSASFAG